MDAIKIGASANFFSEGGVACNPKEVESDRNAFFS
jgi:hypothetical protein